MCSICTYMYINIEEVRATTKAAVLKLTCCVNVAVLVVIQLQNSSRSHANDWKHHSVLVQQAFGFKMNGTQLCMDATYHIY